MSKQKPGPWKWWTSNSYRRLMAGTTTVAYPYICSDGHPDIQISDEDASLIETAPELLEALLLAREYVAKTEGVIPRDSTGRNLVSPDLEKIDAVIAKAKGAA